MMMHLTKNRIAASRMLALGFLLAALIAMPLSTAPADAAVTSAKVFAWGENFAGQLGNGNTGTDSSVPVAVKSLRGVKSVKAGYEHGLALKTDGTVYAWGDNEAGQLGNGTNDDSNVPVKVKIGNVKAISAGYQHSLALKENGTVWAWGSNGYGELGNGTNDLISNVPVKIVGLTGVKAISAGQNFSLALMEDGTVRSWGDNYYGQLGNGTSGMGTSRNTPGPVANLTGVTRIAAPEVGRHALALKQNGNVFFWGFGPDGDWIQTFEQTSVPMRVQNVSNVKSIDAGYYFSLFLMQDGTVKGLGENQRGQLGDDSFQTKGEPVAVKGLGNVRAISAGYDHALALKGDGTVWSWGSDYAGQLGDGPDGNTDENDPGKVGGLSGIESVSAGYQISYAR